MDDLTSILRTIIKEVVHEELEQFFVKLIKEKPDIPDVTLPADTVCKELGIAYATLWRWRKSGHLKPVAYCGRKPVYSRRQIDEFKGLNKSFNL